MQLKPFYLIGSLLICSSCYQKPSPMLAPETIYNSAGQKVITSSFNNRLGSISILYGNAMAQKISSRVLDNHIPGERYNLVTWKQKRFPNWAGSCINGGIMMIETISSSVDRNGKLELKYELIKGPEFTSQMENLNKKRRIDFILNQKASILP